MKKFLIVLAATAGLLLILGAAGFLYIRELEKDLAEFLNNPSIITPNLEHLGDGIYPGKFKAGPIQAAVELRVKNHRITDFTLVQHVSGKGQGAETITGSIVAGSTLDVDTVTGATYSSLVILKAAQNALESGGTE